MYIGYHYLRGHADINQETKLLSRAAIALHTLVGALCEARFFDESVAYRDQQTKFFPPMSMGFSGQRTRYAHKFLTVSMILTFQTCGLFV
jgi:hypothetical protein